MVEIASLTEHLLTECDKKDMFGKCYRCSEAILEEELPRHIKTRACNRECLLEPRVTCGWVVGSEPLGVLRAPEACSLEIVSAAKPEKLANRCPLCHENFAPGEEVRGLTGR